MDFLTNIWTWIKSNWIIAILIAVAIMFVFFGRQVKRLLGITKRRVKHRRPVRRSLPRSVGIRRNKGPVQRTAAGKVKKPWQIRGSEAARRHMAKIRRMR